MRIYKTCRKRKKEGFKRCKGNAKEICRQITKGCFNGRYFQVSNNNFPEFWTRDFGFCAESLVKLGYKKEVLKTLEYSLGIFSEQNKITTTIIPGGKAIDVFTFSPDSLPLFLRSLRIAKAGTLVKKHKNFLEKEIQRYFNIVLDKKTGLVKKKNFSSMKDYAKRKSSCYDNVMMALLSEETDKLKLKNPFSSYNLKKIIKENFWTGKYFLDDISGSKHIAGDANVFPFWTGIFKDKKMIGSSIKTIQKSKLDRPFPLKYSNVRLNTQKMSAQEVFVYGYEADAIWMHMGPLYIKMVQKVDMKKAKEYIAQYTKIIEKYGTYLEVFNSQGKPFETPFYLCDEGMLWASIYLDFQ